jgi:hypothetical protein
VRQRVLQTVRLRVKNDYCDISAGQMLLVFDTLIDSKDVEFGCLRRRKKLTIFQSSQSGVTGCLTIVIRQRVPESLFDTFVDQNAHLWTCEQKVFCFFERSDGRFTRDGRKSLQKVFERLSAFKVVEQRLDRHSRSAKHRSSTKNIPVLTMTSTQ